MESTVFRAKVASAGIRPRLGFSVFVDNVSKRIHHTSLKEAFQVYGQVIDVFIAHRNMKRIAKLTTFAFVRFKNEVDAKSAVQKGNGKLMDGFHIRVFIAKKKNESRRIKDNGVREKLVISPCFLKDMRSFKDVLLGIKKHDRMHHPDCSVEEDEKYVGRECSQSVDCGRVGQSRLRTNNRSRVHSALIHKEEMEWRKRCLVSQIKGMYNLEIIQEALSSDGFIVEVCPWHGLLAGMQFPSTEALLQIWNRREEMLRLWFKELEILEGFDGKRK